MKYYICERKFEDYNTKTAGVKARDDVEAILEQEGFKAVNVWPELGDRTAMSVTDKLKMHKKMGDIWKEKLSFLKKDDVLFVQMPVVNNSFMLGAVLKKLRKKGVLVISLIHDLELLRMSSVKNIPLKQKLRMQFEEKSMLAQSDVIIAHNKEMIKYLHRLGIEGSRIVSLQIFDYLADSTAAAAENASQKNTFIVAGNLSPQKSAYVYKAPQSVKINLYGVNYQENDKNNLCYKGAYAPDELISHLEGGFGLVWDGDSPDTCTGAYGEYLRFNNPHKTSLYLAAGFPVAIWKEAALAGFIENEGAGITASSLDSAAKLAASVTDSEYAALCAGARAVSEKLRSGWYLKNAIREALADI